MSYVDGYVLPIPKSKVAAYRKMATKASKVWRDHGAVEYYESVGDDLKIPGLASFLKLTRAKASETVVFAWVVYKSRAHRDQVNKKVMSDPRLAKMVTDPMPFDMKRMAMGGFKIIVKA